MNPRPLIGLMTTAAVAIALAGCASGPRPQRIPTQRDRLGYRRDNEDHPVVQKFNEAMVLTTQLKYDTAAAMFQKVINPLDEMGDRDRAAEAMFWLGYCREAQGMVPLARKVYQRLMEVYPNTAPANRAAQRLIELDKPPETPAKASTGA